MNHISNQIRRYSFDDFAQAIPSQVVQYSLIDIVQNITTLHIKMIEIISLKLANNICKKKIPTKLIKKTHFIRKQKVERRFPALQRDFSSL